jgi:hypothetical protein
MLLRSALSGASLTGNPDKAIIRTIMNDLNTSGEVQMYNPDVLAGVTLMEQLGLIGPGRGAQIISMTPPPT